MAKATSAPEKRVTIGDVELVLRVPAKFSVRYEIMAAHEKNGLRAIFAALGVCWKAGGGDNPKPPGGRYDASYSPLVYGGQVIDDLDERGIDVTAALDAAVAAFHLIVDSLAKAPSDETVEAAKGFSEDEGA